jgi:hypothetical protein
MDEGSQDEAPCCPFVPREVIVNLEGTEVSESTRPQFEGGKELSVQRFPSKGIQLC